VDDAPLRRPAWLRWGLAVASVAVAAALTTGPGGEWLFPEPPERFVHGVTVLYSAAVLTAWLGGRGPGVLAAVLAALVIDWCITPPLYSISLDFDFALRIAVFALSALLVGWLSERRRRLDTPANRRAMPDADRSGWVSTGDVAHVVAFLLSDRAAALTGASLTV